MLSLRISLTIAHNVFEGKHIFLNVGEDVLIFLGAGASTVFGLKTLQDLTQEIVKKMVEAGHGDEIRDIKTALRRFGKVPDFENIYTTLEGLVNPRQGIKDSGPFAAYVAHVCKGLQKIKPHPKFKKILEDSKRFLYEECTITPEKLESKKDVYDKLFNLLDGQKEGRYLSSTVGRGGEEVEIPASRTIVTTNYDMSVELYYAQRIADGFVTTRDQYIKEFNPRNFAESSLNFQWLLKLHGSIWQFYDKGKFCKAILAPERLPHKRLRIIERMMIYPVGEKPILREPYYTFYKIFKEQPWGLMVAIGHSFRDLPINIAVLENLQNRSTSKLIIVDRSPKKAFKNLGVMDQKLSERIICVEGKFGEPETFKKLQLALQSSNPEHYQKNLRAVGIE